MGANQVIELRQYTLRERRRDQLITLFEEKFIEPQEALGAHVIGTFRDVDDPDRFVWLRGFSDMAARKTSLSAFYGGPAWKAHRVAANATMVDSDNVLLLKPACMQDGFSAAPADQHQRSVYSARIFALNDVEEAEFAHMFSSTILPLLMKLGAIPIAAFVSETAPNNFPALPIRSDRVFVWLGRWPSLASEQRFEDNWHRSTGWRDAFTEKVFPALARKPERLRLLPTDRSALS